MIINGKSTQGIFLYSRNLEFEKNDFVVSGNSIYICTAKYPTNQQNQTVSGEDPKESSRNFKLYPGEMITSREEFDEYFKLLQESSPDLPEDKLVSSYVVADVLQSLHYGLSLSGIISEFIEDSSESPLPLDDLMRSATINNGTVYVSPEVSQIEDIKPIIGPTGSYNQYNLLLKQYTYIGEKSSTGENRWVRVQELINPYTGYTAFRYTTRDGDAGEFGETISTWRSSYTYSGVDGPVNEISNTLKALESFYTTRMNQMASTLETLRGSFRFRDLNPTQVGSTTEYTIPKDSGVVTLTIGNNSNSIKVETITYDFSPGSSTSLSYYIYLNNFSGQIRVRYGGSLGDDFIHLTLPSGLRIIDSYKREYYEEA